MTSDAALRYYEGPELTSTVFEALRRADRPVDQLDPDDLAARRGLSALSRHPPDAPIVQQRYRVTDSNRHRC